MGTAVVRNGRPILCGRGKLCRTNDGGRGRGGGKGGGVAADLCAVIVFDPEEEVASAPPVLVLLKGLLPHAPRDPTPTKSSAAERRDAMSRTEAEDPAPTAL